MNVAKPSGQEPILRLTDAAFRQIAEIRASEPNPEQLALGIEVSGVSDGRYTYDMYFQALSDVGTGHTVQHHDDLSVVIPNSDVDKIRGATLDLSSDPAAAGGMVIHNPNRPEPPRASPRIEGGCAGCGMAAVTLSQGIEVAIFDAVPEIRRVVDVTDHASGTNPYYEAAKK